MVERRARAIEALTKDSDPVANLLLEFLIADLEAEPAALRLLVAELESQVALSADAHENAHSENRGEIVRLCHELDAAKLEVGKLSETVASEGAEVLRLLNECSELLQERDEAVRRERELREKFNEAIAEIQRLTGELEAASDQRTAVKLPEENVLHVSGTGEAAATPDEADQAEQELVEELGSAVVILPEDQSEKHARTYATLADHVIALWHELGSVTAICQRLAGKGVTTGVAREILTLAGIDHTEPRAKSGPKPPAEIARDEFGFSEANRKKIRELHGAGVAVSRMMGYLPPRATPDTVRAYLKSLESAPATHPYDVARRTELDATKFDPQQLVQAIRIVAEDQDLSQLSAESVAWIETTYSAWIEDYRACRTLGDQQVMRGEWLQKLLAEKKEAARG